MEQMAMSLMSVFDLHFIGSKFGHYWLLHVLQLFVSTTPLKAYLAHSPHTELYD